MKANTNEPYQLSSVIKGKEKKIILTFVLLILPPWGNLVVVESVDESEIICVIVVRTCIN